MIRQLERQRSREVLDGADLFEDLFEPLVEEPLEGFVLDGEQVGEGQDLGDLGERETFSDARSQKSLLEYRNDGRA